MIAVWDRELFNNMRYLESDINSKRKYVAHIV